jgi:hypothetical protein
MKIAKAFALTLPEKKAGVKKKTKRLREYDR